MYETNFCLIIKATIYLKYASNMHTEAIFNFKTHLKLSIQFIKVLMLIFVYLSWC